MILHTISLANAAYQIDGSPFVSCLALAFLSITRPSVSLIQVVSVKEFGSETQVKLQCLEMENVLTTAQHSTSTPQRCSTRSPMKFTRLGGARYRAIKEVFTDFDIAAITFESRGRGFRMSTRSDITRSRVLAFLRTTYQEHKATWLEALQTLTPNSKFSIVPLRLGVDTYFNVRVHVRFEGEVLISIQETPQLLSTLNELNSKMLERLERLQQDPNLLTLQWTGRSGGSQDDASVTACLNTDTIARHKTPRQDQLQDTTAVSRDISSLTGSSNGHPAVA